DGIRDLTVTGVQTCALPIFAELTPATSASAPAGPSEPTQTTTQPSLPGMISASEAVEITRGKQLTETTTLPENRGAVAPPPVPPLPTELAELLKESETAGEMMFKQLLDYTYQLKKTR